MNSVWVEDNFGGGHVTCLTSHLTTFAVFAGDTPVVTTTASSITTISSGKSVSRMKTFTTEHDELLRVVSMVRVKYKWQSLFPHRLESPTF